MPDEHPGFIFVFQSERDRAKALEWFEDPRRIAAIVDQLGPHEFMYIQREAPVRPRGGGAGVKLHPRYRQVEAARIEFDLAVWELARKHDLTYGELFSILANAGTIVAKYQIRLERHPDDPGKKGDEK
jgi:hypothetical protein